MNKRKKRAVTPAPPASESASSAVASSAAASSTATSSHAASSAVASSEARISPAADRAEGVDMSQSLPNTPEDRIKECLEFPDIYETPPKQGPDQARIEKLNAQRARLYRAVRYILNENFGFRDGVPADPSHFPGSRLNASETARFCAVYGQLLAENWTDPSLGRQVPADGDLLVGSGDTAIIVTRRFVEAVVDAVKNHAANAQLFLNVFGFLRDTGADAAESRQQLA
jgi:hypothetical protein